MQDIICVPVQDTCTIIDAVISEAECCESDIISISRPGLQWHRDRGNNCLWIDRGQCGLRSADL